jgi:hypothetical protein
MNASLAILYVGIAKDQDQMIVIIAIEILQKK